MSIFKSKPLYTWSADAQLAVTGMTYLPESRADDWPLAAKLAFEQAREY
jgi:hypothetical protein